MPYRRVIIPDELPRGDVLTAAMIGIGMNFPAKPLPEPNIEDTLVATAVEGMDGGDLRVLAVLATWLGIHHPWVNADRLIRIVHSQQSNRVRVFWAAIAHWLSKDRRLARLRDVDGGIPVDLLSYGTEFQIRHSGEDCRFENTRLRVPAGVLPHRPGDVLTPAQLAKRHSDYRYRVLMGPTYRADMWAALNRDPTLSPAQIARRTYGPFATAWQVKQNWKLLIGDDHGQP